MDLKQFKEMSEERQFNSLRRTLRKQGYVFFDKGDYNLNIIAIRNIANLSSTKFNDLVAVAYMIDDIKHVHLFKATTDPGRTYRLKPINKKGTASVLPQQVQSGLKIGSHKGYPALIQNKPFWVLRNNDRNDLISEISLYSMGEINETFILKPLSDTMRIVYNLKGDKIVNLEYGMFGINFHRASKWKILENVGLYSAGCIVQQDPYRFRNEFLKLVNKARLIYSDKFTMTLITNDKLH